MCDADLVTLERFVVLLYQRTSPFLRVNEARKRLFACGNRKSENIPPTRAALMQHAKRAAFQAGHVRGQSLVANVRRRQTEAGRMLEVPGSQYGAPWEKHQKCVASLSNVPAKVTARAGASVIKSNLPCTQ